MTPIHLLMLVYGIIIIVRNKVSIGKGKVLLGGRARLCGWILISPLPLAVLLAFILVLMDEILGTEFTKGNNRLYANTVCTLSAICLSIILWLILKDILYKKQEAEYSDKWR